MVLPKLEVEQAFRIAMPDSLIVAMADYEFPLWTNFLWMLGLSGILLFVFHCLLVWICPLTSVGWKKVDYIWVSLTFLGIVAGVEQNREIFAKNYRDLALQRAEHRFSMLKDSVAFGHSSAICREFIRTEGSPPADVMAKLQLEYDAQCAWFTELDALVSELDATMMVPMDLGAMHDPQPAGGDGWAYRRLEECVDKYNAEVKAFLELGKLAKMSDLKSAALALGPFLLTIAVALRITKVTGEIRLEKAKEEKKRQAAADGLIDNS